LDFIFLEKIMIKESAALTNPKLKFENKIIQKLGRVLNVVVKFISLNIEFRS